TERRFWGSRIGPGTRGVGRFSTPGGCRINPRVRLASAGSSQARTQDPEESRRYFRGPRTTPDADPPPPDVREGLCDGLIPWKTPQAPPEGQTSHDGSPRSPWRIVY